MKCLNWQMLCEDDVSEEGRTYRDGDACDNREGAWFMSPGMLAYPTQSEIASAAHFVPTYSETVSRLGHTRSCPFPLHTLAVLERTPTQVCG